MEIEKKLVQKHYWPKNLPEWQCPLCNKGILHTQKKDIQIIESIETATEHSEEWFDWDMCKGAFSGRLVCQNPKCGETIFFSGKADVDRIYDEDGPTSEYDWRIEPRYFSTPIKLFPIEKYPKFATPIINEAFGLLWTNESSCANKIGVLVEKILDDLEIAKFRPKGKRIPVSIQTRISKLKNKEAAHFFEAIKWLRHAGSHDTDMLSREDLVDAFEMIGEVINILYNPHLAKLKTKAKNVIKSKGPAKPKKMKFGIN